ncbi:MAG: FTR1 family protein [Dehalococcoidia bacterium]|nr:FTR1 family protein [Dehalococcoidia bacterium]
MVASLLITLREVLEAAPIISIILAFLSRTGQSRILPSVWLGTGAAVALSVAAGAIVFWTAGELSRRAEEIYEGTAGGG